jgi:hypothetical protein
MSFVRDDEEEEEEEEEDDDDDDDDGDELMRLTPILQTPDPCWTVPNQYKQSQREVGGQERVR